MTEIAMRDLEELIKNEGKDIPLTEVIGKFDFLFFGETHFNPDVRRDLRRRIPELQRLGIKAYGAEAPINLQNEFDRIFQSFRDGSYYPTPAEMLFGPIKDPSYKSLVYELARDGIYPFPFDVRRSEDVNLEEAESLMAEVIKNYFQEYGPTAILVGSHHVQRGYGKLIDFLEKEGYKCISVIYHGGDTTGKHMVEMAARSVGKGSDRFVLNNSSHLIPPGADYIIHLPQRIRRDFLSPLIKRWSEMELMQKQDKTMVSLYHLKYPLPGLNHWNIISNTKSFTIIFVFTSSNNNLTEVNEPEDFASSLYYAD